MARFGSKPPQAHWSGLFVPKPSPYVIIVGNTAADLLALSVYVRGRLRTAATIVTQLVTHLRLAARVITCL